MSEKRMRKMKTLMRFLQQLLLLQLILLLTIPLLFQQQQTLFAEAGGKDGGKKRSDPKTTVSNSNSGSGYSMKDCECNLPGNKYRKDPISIEGVSGLTASSFIKVERYGLLEKKYKPCPLNAQIIHYQREQQQKKSPSQNSRSGHRKTSSSNNKIGKSGNGSGGGSGKKISDKVAYLYGGQTDESKLVKRLRSRMMGLGLHEDEHWLFTTCYTDNNSWVIIVTLRLGGYANAVATFFAMEVDRLYRESQRVVERAAASPSPSTFGHSATFPQPSSPQQAAPPRSQTFTTSTTSTEGGANYYYHYPSQSDFATAGGGGGGGEWPMGAGGGMGQGGAYYPTGGFTPDGVPLYAWFGGMSMNDDEQQYYHYTKSPEYEDGDENQEEEQEKPRRRGHGSKGHEKPPSSRQKKGSRRKKEQTSRRESSQYEGTYGDYSHPQPPQPPSDEEYGTSEVPQPSSSSTQAAPPQREKWTEERWAQAQESRKRQKEALRQQFEEDDDDGKFDSAIHKLLQEEMAQRREYEADMQSESTQQSAAQTTTAEVNAHAKQQEDRATATEVAQRWADAMGNLYALLGTQPGVTSNELKAARAATQKELNPSMAHNARLPDREKAILTAKSQLVNDAYTTLRVAAQREEYDQQNGFQSPPGGY